MKYCFFALVFLLLTAGVVWSQSDTTPTPQPLQSIFDYDTCAPPCWMGLIPGVSTIEDVENLLEAYPDLFPIESRDTTVGRIPSGERDIDPDIGRINTAYISFDIGEVRPDDFFISRVEIREGVVSVMVILNYETLDLASVFNSYGMPDTVRLVDSATDLVHLLLIYEDIPLRVNLHYPSSNCTIRAMIDGALVDSIIYYSLAGAMRLTTYDYDIPQHDLTGYRLLSERDVSMDVWQAWLNGDVDMSCEEAWVQLPAPEITPAVEVTVEAQATPTSR